MGRVEEKQSEQSCVGISNWRTKPFKPTFTLSHRHRWSQLALPIIHHSISWFHQLCYKLVLEIITRFTLDPRKATQYIHLVLISFWIDDSVSSLLLRNTYKSLNSYISFYKKINFKYIHFFWKFKLNERSIKNQLYHNLKVSYFQCWERLYRESP